jgi:DNA-binding LacI/PurR family transcriptional regulator
MTRPTIRDRHAGYRLALSDYGIPFDPELLFEVPSMRPSNGLQVARQALEEGRLDATGIFCSNDMLAVGVASAIDSAGLSVPEDFSIVGFDNTRVTARHRPSLTTLGVDLTEIGRQSVRRLLEHMHDPDLPPVEIQIGCNLIVRESSGPPRSRP